MNYEAYETAIADKFGVIIEHWPLETFAAPGKFCTLVELRTLHNAWASGATRFRKLSDEEFKARKQRSLAQVLGQTPPEVSATATDDMAPTPVDPVTADPGVNAGVTGSAAPALASAPPATAGAAPRTKKPRKDKGIKRGPNARTRARQAQAAAAQAAAE